jgi:cellulose synthase (UDP-forming)
MAFEEFLTAAVPVGAIGTILYLHGQRWLCDPPAERGLHWRGVLLKLGTWPVYLAGTIMGVLRLEIPYRPTPKQALRGKFLPVAAPHLILLGVLVVTAGRVLVTRVIAVTDASLGLSAQAVWAMLGFASVAALASVASLAAAWQSRRAPDGDPWDEVDVDALGGPP